MNRFHLHLLQHSPALIRRWSQGCQGDLLQPGPGDEATSELKQKPLKETACSSSSFATTLLCSSYLFNWELWLYCPGHGTALLQCIYLLPDWQLLASFAPSLCYILTFLTGNSGCIAQAMALLCYSASTCLTVNSWPVLHLHCVTY